MLFDEDKTDVMEEDMEVIPEEEQPGFRRLDELIDTIIDSAITNVKDDDEDGSDGEELSAVQLESILGRELPEEVHIEPETAADEAETGEPEPLPAVSENALESPENEPESVPESDDAAEPEPVENLDVLDTEMAVEDIIRLAEAARAAKVILMRQELKDDEEEYVQLDPLGLEDTAELSLEEISKYL